MKSLNYKILLTTFSYILILNFIVPPIGDDFGLAKISNGINSAIISYMNWNARFYELLYRSYLARLNPFIFDFINAIAATAFVALSYYLLFARLPRGKNDTFIILSFSMLLIVGNFFEEFCLWQSGSVNYLWSIVGALAFAIPYRLYFANYTQEITPKFIKNKFILFLFAILSFSVGLSHEVLGAIIGIIFVFVFIYALLARIKIPCSAILGVVCFGLGFYMLYFSPGENVRMLYETQNNNFISISDILSLSFSEIISRIYQTYTYYFLKTPAILLLSLFCVLFFKLYKKVFYKNIIIFSCAFALYLYIVMISPLLSIATLVIMQGILALKTKRFTPPLIILIIWCACGIIFVQFGEGIPLRSRIFDLILLLYVIILNLESLSIKNTIKVFINGVIIVFLCFNLYEYIQIRLKWNALSEYVEEQKRLRGNDIDIVYSKDKFNITYFVASGWWKFNENLQTNNQKRKNGYAEAFGVRSFDVK